MLKREGATAACVAGWEAQGGFTVHVPDEGRDGGEAAANDAGCYFGGSAAVSDVEMNQELAWTVDSRPEKLPMLVVRWICSTHVPDANGETWRDLQRLKCSRFRILAHLSEFFLQSGCLQDACRKDH